MSDQLTIGRINDEKCVVSLEGFGHLSPTGSAKGWAAPDSSGRHPPCLRAGAGAGIRLNEPRMRQEAERHGLGISILHSNTAGIALPSYHLSCRQGTATTANLSKFNVKSHWKAEKFFFREKTRTNCAAKFLFANPSKGSNFLTGE